MIEHFKAKRGKSLASTKEAQSPVLSEEDEEFIHRIATEGVPPELPQRPGPPLPQRPQDLAEAGDAVGNNAQLAIIDDAQVKSLSGEVETANVLSATAEQGETVPSKEESKGTRSSRWSWLKRDSRDRKRKATATDLMSAAEGLKSPDARPNEDGIVSDPEASKEEDEMTSVLEELNLAAVNNRVFSVSKESQELLHKSDSIILDTIQTYANETGSHLFSKTLSMVSRRRMAISNRF